VAKYYPAGFRKPVELVGAYYSPPKGTTNRVINLTEGMVSFVGGNLSSSFENIVHLAANNKVTNLSSNRLALRISLPNGLFSGTITPPGATKTTPFKGALLQKFNAGFGNFMGTNQSGYVDLHKAP
jgi:hypothetical protein